MYRTKEKFCGKSFRYYCTLLIMSDYYLLLVTPPVYNEFYVTMSTAFVNCDCFR